MIAAAPAMQDDVAILERIARRDPDGLASLYDRYGGLAFSYAYHLLRERDAAEDAVHAAFLNVWRCAAMYDAHHGVARTWLLMIVHHQAIARGRQPWEQ